MRSLDTLIPGACIARQTVIDAVGIDGGRVTFPVVIEDAWGFGHRGFSFMFLVSYDVLRVVLFATTISLYSQLCKWHNAHVVSSSQ